MEQKETNKDLKEPKVYKNSWAKTMENIVLHLKLLRGMRGVLLTYVVQHHTKVAYILSGYGTYLNLDKEMMVTRAPIVDKKFNSRLTWIEIILTISVIHSKSTVPWCIIFSQRSSHTWTHMYM